MLIKLFRFTWALVRITTVMRILKLLAVDTPKEYNELGSNFAGLQVQSMFCCKGNIFGIWAMRSSSGHICNNTVKYIINAHPKLWTSLINGRNFLHKINDFL